MSLSRWCRVNANTAVYCKQHFSDVFCVSGESSVEKQQNATDHGCKYSTRSNKQCLWLWQQQSYFGYLRQLHVKIIRRFVLEKYFNPKRAGGGGIRPPSTFFCYISAGCYFFALKILDFFSSSLALDLRPIFIKIGPRVMTRRCVIACWVQRKTDFPLKLHTNRVFCLFCLSGYTFTMFYLIYLVYLEYEHV